MGKKLVCQYKPYWKLKHQYKLSELRKRKREKEKARELGITK